MAASIRENLDKNEQKQLNRAQKNIKGPIMLLICCLARKFSPVEKTMTSVRNHCDEVIKTL